MNWESGNKLKVSLSYDPATGEYMLTVETAHTLYARDMWDVSDTLSSALDETSIRIEKQTAEFRDSDHGIEIHVWTPAYICRSTIPADLLKGQPNFSTEIIEPIKDVLLSRIKVFALLIATS